MNFIGLVVHGLSAISVFSDIVGVRLLVFSLALSMAAASTFLLALFSPSSASPLASQWILTAGSILLVLFAQATFTICGLAILILSSRNSLNFIPLRDHPFFVERFTKFPGEIDRKDG